MEITSACYIECCYRIISGTFTGITKRSIVPIIMYVHIRQVDHVGETEGAFVNGTLYRLQNDLN